MNIEDLRSAAIQAIVRENNLAQKPFLSLQGIGRTADTRSLTAVCELSDLTISPETACHAAALLALAQKGRKLTAVQKIVIALSNREPGF